jgi:addiction module RelE/StbE family toxin
MRLRWTPIAAEDLESIYVYLCRHRPTWAESTIQTLYIKAQSLRTMSDRGRPGAIAGTRELVLKDLPYIIVYRVKDQMVEILHINHAAQDLRTN